MTAESFEFSAEVLLVEATQKWLCPPHLFMDDEVPVEVVYRSDLLGPEEVEVAALAERLLLTLEAFKGETLPTLLEEVLPRSGCDPDLLCALLSSTLQKSKQ